MAQGLKGRFARKYRDWRVALDGAFRRIEDEPVLILVWGPGKSWKDYYAKREELCKHLNATQKNDARTSEDLIENDERFRRLGPQRVYRGEQMQLGIADVVFVLIVKDSRVTGVQTEVAKWEDNAMFQQKAYVLVPELTEEEREGGSFLSLGWVNYTNHRFDYTPEMYSDCTRIRDYCSSVVDGIRTDRGLRALEAEQA
jgi:hypothetical protein